MRTLYPPLEECSPTTGREQEAPMQDGHDDNDVLSPELRQHFNTMRRLIQQEEDAQKKRKDAPHQQLEELQLKKHQTAVETALAMDNELSRLRNGIAELEALLAQQEGRSIIHEFPSLPPIVVSDEVENFEEKAESKVDGKMIHG
jgi:hypothetical protein